MVFPGHSRPPVEGIRDQEFATCFRSLQHGGGAPWSPAPRGVQEGGRRLPRGGQTEETGNAQKPYHHHQPITYKATAGRGMRAADKTGSSQYVQDFIMTQAAAKMNSCTHWGDQNHHQAGEPLEAELTGSPTKAKEWPKTKIKWPDDQGEKKRSEIAAAPVSHLALPG